MNNKATEADEKIAEMFAQSVAPLQEKMVERLTEKYDQWKVSWRDAPFPDGRLMIRLRRAVDHLEAALHVTDYEIDPDVLVRAADVANLAMIAADPRRIRSAEKDGE